MVQLTFDTNHDSLEELQEALKILQQALERRGSPEVPHHAKPVHKPSKMDIAQPEEESIETPFFKITVKSDDEPKAMPTLNQMIEDESLSDDDLSKLFHEQVDREHDEHKAHPQKEHVKDNQKEESSGAYIEIVEYTDEK